MFDLAATDADLVNGDSLTFTIAGVTRYLRGGGTANDSDGLFEIVPGADGATAVLTIDADQVFFTDTSYYEIVVDVIDEEGFSSSANFTVMVTDLGQGPTLLDTGFTIYENRETGYYVGTLVATDPDPGEVLRYTIIGSNTAGQAYSLEKLTGRINVANGSQTDYENVDNRNAVLSVLVKDHDGLTDTATVTIDLLDLYQSPSQQGWDGNVTDSLTLSEDTTAHTVIATYDVSDIDPEFAIGDKATLEGVAGNDNGAFSVQYVHAAGPDLSNADASFIGESIESLAGWSVSDVGDVNNDGFDDFVIGAYGAADYAGKSYLILGSATLSMDMDLSTADATFVGELWEESGTAVSGVGDVNNDGYDDFVIGAYGNSEGGSMAGQTYLILGRSSADWALVGSMFLSSADASFIGEDADDHSGRAVSGVGDVNNDGYDDFIIGAQGDDDGGSSAGQTYLILGRASWSMDMDLSTADASFIGEDTYDNSGYAVSGVGDVNNDGYDDFIIGAYGDEEGGANAGQTYLILGRASWSMDMDLSTADASFIGEDGSDRSGYAVSGAGDVNGDGYDDIIIGAYGDDDGGDDAGQTYLVLGRATGWSMDTDLSTADASFIGEDGSDRSGYAVSGAGDVNNDGYDDFIIGAYGNDDGGTSAGQTYLILGRATGWAMDTDLSTADSSYVGEDGNDYSGRTLSGAGDANNDGYGDFIIGAWGDDDGGSGAGQTYLILGRPGAQSVTVTLVDNTVLDYETTPLWGGGPEHYVATLTLEVADSEGLTGTRELEVLVSDVPEILEIVSVNLGAVYESSPDGTLAASLDITGIDLGDTFSIVSGNDDGAFAIDPATGTVTVADRDALDHELASVRSLTVRGASATNTDEVVIPINILDVYEADLTVTKSDGGVTVREGDTVTYTITVTNTGDTDAVGAVVQDPFNGLMNVQLLSVNTTAGSGYAPGAQDRPVHFLNLDGEFHTNPDGSPFELHADQDALDVGVNLGEILGERYTTLSFWINTTQVPDIGGADGQYVDGGIAWLPAITGYNSGNARTVENTDMFWGVLQPDGQISLSVGGVIATSTTAINDGQWHHVALSRSRDNISVYVDGVREATSSGAGDDVISVVFSTLGRAEAENPEDYRSDDLTSFNAVRSFEGLLDDVRVFNGVMADADVVNVMNDDAAAPASVHAWDFDAVTGGLTVGTTAAPGVLTNGLTDTVDLPVGASITYVVQGTVAPVSAGVTSTMGLYSSATTVTAPFVSRTIGSGSTSDGAVVELSAVSGGGAFIDTILGDASYANDVALGDVDGDGDLDAWVVYGNTADGSGTAGVLWMNDGDGNFTDSGQSLGTSLSGAVTMGDLDGDGDLDAVVADYAVDSSSETFIHIWLNQGGAQGGVQGQFTESSQAFRSADTFVETDLSDADASFIGQDDGDLSGRSVSGVGDVNNDGYDDFVIGAVGDEEGGSYAGQTYLILGGATWSMDTSLSTASASFIGEAMDDFSGFSVSGVGDVNNDGYDDFAIGASYNDDGGEDTGQTYLILGRATGSWSMDMDLSLADASFIGEEVEDFAGHCVSGVGDVNNDGYDDFIIGANSNDEGGEDAGQTYLILGRATGLWSMDMDLSLADASFIGEDARDNSGMAVSGVGDVNNDGYDDFVIGATGDDDGGSLAGQSYLILGRAAWSMDMDLSNANASFIGEDAYDKSGSSVSGVGDVNNDGYDDFVIGATGDDDGGSSAGQTYLLLGRATGLWSMGTDLSMANASFIGENANDNSGYAVSGVGDVNGDGYDDFVIGAMGDDDGGNAAGQTYLLLGRATGAWSEGTDLATVEVSFIGEDAGDNSGRAVSGVGDVNNDGFDDFAISATGDDDGGISAGQTYLILGSATGWGSQLDSLYRSSDLILADVDNDGDVDLFHAGSEMTGDGNVIWLNDGSGVFTSLPQLSLENGLGIGNESVAGAVAGDLDGDDDPDLLLDAANGNTVYLNDGTGQFFLAASALASLDRAVLGDVDGDGDLDLLDNGGLYLNDGSGQWTAAGVVLTVAGRDNRFGDLDGDGDIDLLSLGPQDVTVYFNDGAGSFAQGSTWSGGLTENRELEVADLDGDGDLDIWSVGDNGSQLWFNVEDLNLTVPDSLTGYEDTRVGLDAVSVYSPHDNNSYQAALTLNAGEGAFLYDGQQLATVSVTDTIAALNTLLTGTITLLPPGQYSGDVTVTVTVDDGSMSITDDLVVTVLPVNDAPTLTPATVDLTTAEDSLIIDIPDITAGDVDGDPLAQQRVLTISLPDSQGTFSTLSSSNINFLSTTLNISEINTTLGNLQFTPAENYNGEAVLSVAVADQAGAQALGTVTIDVTAVNDLPLLTGDSAFSMDENTSVVLGSPTASDADGEELTLTVTLGDTNFGLLYMGDEQGREMELTGAPDELNDMLTSLVFEPQNDFYGVVDIVYLLSDSEAFDSFTLNVSIVSDGLEAVNDPPSLSLENVTATIVENVTGGMVIADIVIDDDTLGTNILQLSGGDAGLFEIGYDIDSLKLKLRSDAVLDFETQPSLNVTVEVNDAEVGSNPDDFHNLTIFVTDANEAPQVEDTAFILNENLADGSFVDVLIAVDHDTGDTITYAIVDGSGQVVFEIEQTTGVIRVLDGTLLDYETTTQFELTVEVTDSSGLSDQATVTLQLADVNEAPVIDVSLLGVVENAAAGTVVGTATVSDPDAADAGLHSFEILPGTGSAAFAIDASTGEITVADPSLLNFEASAFLNITVRATDPGGLSDEAALEIELIDVNEVPSISYVSYIVDENSVVGTTVGTPVTVDPDISAGDILSYAITGGSGQGIFAIDPDTGEISVTDSAALDYETTMSFDLNVRVTDSGGLTDDATIDIFLADVDDITPVVAAGQILSVDENSANTTVVGTLAATDGDVTPAIFSGWTITGGSGATAFALDSGTGVISVADSSQLDRETTESFTLDVTVSDGVHTSAAETVTITLDDVNEFAPVAADAAFTLEENSPDGTLVGTLTATDADVTDGDISYQITAGNNSGGFAIDDNGSITVADSSPLNFESNPGFLLEVSVSDGELSSTTGVTVTLINVDDPGVFGGDTSGSADMDAGPITGTLTFFDAVDGASVPNFRIEAGDEATNGSAVIDSVTGGWTYTPTAGC